MQGGNHSSILLKLKNLNSRETMSLGILFLGLLSTIASSSACSDTWSPHICKFHVQLCNIDAIGQFCAKTCGRCTGTAPPLPTKAPETPAPQPTCGIPAVSQSRVIGGQAAKVGAWPWQIAMFIQGYYACGGSLVTPRWIVTAAHCVQQFSDPGKYKVVLGTNNLNEKSPFEQMIAVEKVISHPKYGNMNNDIALLKLARPAVLNDRVKTVCLPKADDKVPVGTKCFLSGFGKTKHPGGPSPILQQTDLPVVSQSTCARLNTAITGIRITPEMVCAGHGPSNIKSGCHGDSGGPFVCQYGNGNAFTLQGAVSWGSGTCNSRQSYSVFTRISAFRNWIDQYITEN